MTDLEPIELVEPEPRRRPEHHITPQEWVHANLFAGWFNSVLTVVFGTLLAWVAYRLVRFILVSADWEVVRRNLRLFMVGRFPVDELWRLWSALYLVAAGLGFAFGAAARIALDPALGVAPATRGLAAGARRFWPLLLAGAALVSLTRTVLPGLLLAGAVVALLAGRWLGGRVPRRVASWWWVVLVIVLFGALQVVVAGDGVGWDDWGGLHLTVFVTVAGIALAFPIGLVLALGRRSRMPVIRWLSIIYIEVFRGVPLITLLFLGQFVIFFMFPTYFDPPGLLVRAMIAIVVFEAAYVAEVVRGGLQAVPKGQYEAAQALGLSSLATMRKIVLPQALRAVIPALVGQFISLYKDTSLLSVIGVLEILRVAGAAVTQPDFLGQGLDAVTLPFVGFLYWVGSYTMSRESRRIERRLGVRAR
ncbi:MAG: amino acid ABC transporter permease [Acidimicrobiales bacterium]